MNHIVNWFGYYTANGKKAPPSHAQKTHTHESNVVDLSWVTNAKSGWKIPVDGIRDEENVIMGYSPA